MFHHAGVPPERVPLKDEHASTESGDDIMARFYEFKGLGNAVLFAAERLKVGADYVSIRTTRLIPHGVFYVVTVIGSLDGTTPPIGCEEPLTTSTPHPLKDGRRTTRDKETCGYGSHVWHDSDACDCGEVYASRPCP